MYFWTDFNGKVGLNVALMNFNFTFSRGALGVLGVEGLGGVHCEKFRLPQNLLVGPVW